MKKGEDRADFWSQIFDLNFASLCSCDVARSAGSRVVRRRTLGLLGMFFFFFFWGGAL